MAVVHFVSQPASQQTVSWYVVIDQQRIGAGFTNHQHLFRLAVEQQFYGSLLIFIELTSSSLIQMPPHQTPKFSSAEPGLVF